MPCASVLIVDDHPILRDGIAQLIDREPDLETCAQAGGVDEALAVLASSTVQLAVVDLSLSGRSGFDLLRAVRQQYASVRSLVVSMHEESLYAERALRAGARGYIMKQEAPRKIVTALRTVRDGGIYLSDAMRSRLLERLVEPAPDAAGSPFKGLTDRELEVLRLVGRGMKSGDIARTLMRSVNTVEAHRANIKRKLGLSSAAELARYAYSLGEGTG